MTKTNVLFTASECTPFIKTGGLADVIGSLPQALIQTGTIQARVLLPLYDEIGEEWQAQMTYHGTFPVQLGWRKQEAELYSVEYDGLLYYFIANDFYFSRKGVYGYYDDGERFVFFSKAIIESLPYLDFTPDILHAHDWQTGMAVAFAKILNPVEGLKTIFTIHNIKYQGVMPHEMYHDFLQLSEEHFSGFEWNGMLNCMKSAIVHADKITTVSPSYAEEILDPFYGEGLESILYERKEDLIGILNGIDSQEYNPMKDEHLFVNYRDSRIKKKLNKQRLQAELGLEVNEETPLYLMVTRFDKQKGLQLVQRILHEFLEEDIQFVVLGTGEQEFEDYFRSIARDFEKKAAARIAFDEGLARKMYAGADFFIMPSQFEPCGLAQLIALQYKTVPIVRETGGLRDTITPFNEVTGEGNGFSFANYNAHELLATLRYSLKVYNQEEHWKAVIRNVNRSRFSWHDSAMAYIELYQALRPIRDEVNVNDR